MCSLSKQLGGEKEAETKRSLYAAPLCQHHTSPRTPRTQFIFLPIKVSPTSLALGSSIYARSPGYIIPSGNRAGQSARRRPRQPNKPLFGFAPAAPCGDGKSPCRQKV